ncbi:MAG: protein kinase [Cyanobacteria bacterium]|nr:protein kinase [Cyanobacteriota bacterium]MDW8202508.1 serine/threonine-protein kinase [Cyanobacteriota bacterium SKYGB_h_bin112]
MPLYCRNQHLNAEDSRFCYLCGEPLHHPASSLTPGTVISSRYRITRELGHGGFGRTYEAQDLNRFNEPCVLKEFAPQVEGTQAVQKASELFEREAGVLYRLNHPQVPRFRELLRVTLANGSKLFLVQDFVAGQTYQELLQARKQQGQLFTEADVVQLLRQLLPVLDYLHSVGVVHRDIAPDNLMQRFVDKLPVLIDFGGVKQLAATVASELAGQAATPAATAVPSQGTRLGKVGYAPEEQIRLGIAYPHSDLYALGVTMLVLLTGREPQELLNPQTLEWQWQHYVQVSPALAAILNQMIAHRPNDRFQSANQVLQALNQAGLGGVPLTQLPQCQPRSASAYGAPYSELAVPQPSIPDIPQSSSTPISATTATTPLSESSPQSSTNSSRVWGVALGSTVIVVAATAGWWATHHDRQSYSIPDSAQSIQPPTISVIPSPVATPTTGFSAEEQERKQALDDRRRQLAIDNSFFVRLVNQEFYTANPDLKGRQLTTSKDDELLRAQWDKIANEFLMRLERVSTESRRQLGHYGRADRDRWLKLVNQHNVSSRTLYDLADAQFFHLFQEYRNTNISGQPMEQVWHAIVADQVTDILSGKVLKTVQFATGRFDTRLTGSLQPGKGRSYIAYLSKGQPMRFTWQADQPALVSLYPPLSSQRPLLEDTRHTSWSGTLQESGYYEIVIVADGDNPVNYTIDLAVDKVSNATSNSLTLPTEPSSSL